MTVGVPMGVAETAAPGEYRYGVTVFSDEESERSVSESFAITVTDD